MIKDLLGEVSEALKSVGDSTEPNPAPQVPASPPRPRDERIIRALADADGYVWQGDIADVLGTSKATASRTLAAMEDEERITRYQIGRKKVVCSPHREPPILRETPENSGAR